MSKSVAELVVRAEADERGMIRVNVHIDGRFSPSMLGAMLGSVVGTAARTSDNLDELGIGYTLEDVRELNVAYARAANSFMDGAPTSARSRVFDLPRTQRNPYPDTGSIIWPDGSVSTPGGS